MALAFHLVDRLASVKRRVTSFLQDRATSRIGEFHYSTTGAPNLYSSCYALMTMHYLGILPESSADRRAWAEYLGSWQDPTTGAFMGPELKDGGIDAATHDFEHISMHLATTVLPCLSILEAKPAYPLTFAHKFVDAEVLREWLSRRDWKDAWLEGNNLLFVLQLLIYLRDEERVERAAAAVQQMFEWLDAQIDPKTGLWGTNGYCSSFIAMCGGYHQLLAYYYEKRDICFPRALVDTTLALQHEDGGFAPHGGGGACEDVDAIDILVNLYKRHDYRRAEIRFALRKALRFILSMQVQDGGFVYRLGEEFMHMGMHLTRTPPNASTTFATWFRVHTIALIAEILSEEGAASHGWTFNNSLSMGWHDTEIWFPRGQTLIKAGLQEFISVGARGWVKGFVGYDNILKYRALERRALARK